MNAVVKMPTLNLDFMILFNRLIRTDLLIVVALVLLLIVRSGTFWQGVLEGMIVTMLFISIWGHIDHYKRTKKLY